MPREERSTKDDLQAAALRLVARSGRRGVSVRTIARAAGVTEGALYRHFKSKDDLFAAVYDRIASPMIEEKRGLVASSLPMRERVREWVRLTYASFDRDPEAFAFVFLADTPAPAGRKRDDHFRAQSRLFIELVREGQRSGEVRPLNPELALAYFTGLMLNVPRLIRENVLPGPASDYVEEAADAAWCVLRAEPRDGARRSGGRPGG